MNVFFPILFCLSSSVLFAQYNTAFKTGEPVRQNSVFITGEVGPEVDDAGGHFNIHYQRRFGRKNRTLVRLGFSPSLNYSLFSVPLTLSWMTNPRGKHHFEAGGGLSPRFERYQGQTSYDPFLLVFAMYRFEPPGGFLLRSGLKYYSYQIMPVTLNFAVSLGYSF